MSLTPIGLTNSIKTEITKIPGSDFSQGNADAGILALSTGIINYLVYGIGSGSVGTDSYNLAALGIYVGTPSGSVAPFYSNNNYIINGNNITTAVSKLDTALYNVSGSISASISAIQDVDTLQTVTNRGNTTTNNIQVSASGSIFKSLNVNDVLQASDIIAGTIDLGYIPILTNEPQGFPNRTDSVLNLTEGVFKITPNSSTFDYYLSGQKYTSHGDYIALENTSGRHWIYYDSSGLLVSLIAEEPIWSNAIVAAVYWNADLSGSQSFAEERHGLIMDWTTHHYLHDTVSTRYESGLVAANYTITGNGDVNTHATISIGNGAIWDEDIEIDIVHNNTPSGSQWYQILQPVAEIPVYYRNGNPGNWVKLPTTGFPVLYNVGGRISYNLNTAGTWTIPQATQTNFVASWIIATNNIQEPVVCILGQRQDASLANAQTNNSLSSIDFGTLPYSEMKIIYRLIYQTSTAYSNIPHARLRDVADFRVVSTLPGGSAITTPNLQTVTNVGSTTTNAITINASGSLIRSLAIPDVLTVNKLNINDNVYVSNNYIINGDDLPLATSTLDTALYNISGSINATIVSIGGSTPNLQQVTDVGATTTNAITVSTSGSNFNNLTVQGVLQPDIIYDNVSGSQIDSLAVPGLLTTSKLHVNNASGIANDVSLQVNAVGNSQQVVLNNTTATGAGPQLLFRVSGSNGWSHYVDAANNNNFTIRKTGVANVIICDFASQNVTIGNATSSGPYKLDVIGNFRAQTSGSQINCLSVPGLLTAENLNIGSNIYVSNNYITNGDDLLLSTGKLDTALYNVSGSIAATIAGIVAGTTPSLQAVTNVGATTTNAITVNASGSNIRSLAIPDVLTVNSLNINDNVYLSNNYIINGDQLITATGKLDTALAVISGSINASIAGKTDVDTLQSVVDRGNTSTTAITLNVSGSSIRSLSVPDVLTTHKLNIDANVYLSNNYIINGDDLNLTTSKLDTALAVISGSINATIAGISSGTTPNLQSVTNVGASTTNAITVSVSGSNFLGLTVQGPSCYDGPNYVNVSGSRFHDLEIQGNLLTGTVRASVSGSNFRNITSQGPATIYGELSAINNHIHFVELTAASPRMVFLTTLGDANLVYEGSNTQITSDRKISITPVGNTIGLLSTGSVQSTSSGSRFAAASFPGIAVAQQLNVNGTTTLYGAVTCGALVTMNQAEGNANLIINRNTFTGFGPQLRWYTTGSQAYAWYLDTNNDFRFEGRLGPTSTTAYYIQKATNNMFIGPALSADSNLYKLDVNGNIRAQVSGSRINGLAVPDVLTTNTLNVVGNTSVIGNISGSQTTVPEVAPTSPVVGQMIFEPGVINYLSIWDGTTWRRATLT